MSASEHVRATRFLGDLLPELADVWQQLPVTGVQLDSRKIQSGDLFLACPGHQSDGRDFINEAISFGAAAVFAERDRHWCENAVCQGVPVIVVDKLQERVSEIAANYYGNPSASLSVVGVTGTNGKTSCTQLMASFLDQLQQRCAVIGTLGAGMKGSFVPAINTTPDAVSIQRLLAEWSSDADMVAMEVSSHGLDQHRVDGVQFIAGVFTNLSRDHLDYHGDMAAYLRSKQRLFQHPELRFAVINYDDEYAGDIAGEVGSGTRVLYYSLENAAADVYAERIEMSRDGCQCIVVTPWGQGAMRLPLLGRFNLLNVLAVITTLVACGHPLEKLLEAAARLTPVPGRMQRLEGSYDIEVVVDYAHTPDALEQALIAMQDHSDGAVWCVFGCGGDRDRGKRTEMGAVAARLADRVVLTSDNPRNEDPDQILNDILAGIDTLDVMVERQRERAISYAVMQARPGDSVLIAGKGHETKQIVGDQQLPFSDVEQAYGALAQRGAR